MTVPSEASRRISTAGPAGTMLAGTGLLFLAASLLYNPWTLGLLVGGLGPGQGARVRRSEIAFAVVGFVFLAAFAVARRAVPRFAPRRREAVARVLLSVLVLLVPAAAAELALRPFVPLHHKNTSAFVADKTLGWRLVPQSTYTWGGNDKINGKGLRGPEVPYEKPTGVFRILWLGDSVTIGYLLDSWRLTFPYVAQSLLDAGEPGGYETINAGIDGYSPWQQHLWLAGEGIRYGPDLVVVCFVLNDVTEKFSLVRFGGTDIGFQLQHTATTFLDRAADSIALVVCLRKLSLHLRFGRDANEGVREAERLEVSWLEERPDDPRVRKAWDATRDEIDRIVALCRARAVRVAFVVFPFRFQFDGDPGSAHAQRTLLEWARARGVPALDLLPPLAEALVREGAKPGDYFLDQDHLSPRGSRVVAEMIVEFLTRERLLEREAGG